MEIHNIENSDFSRIKELTAKYRDLPIDFADSCLEFLADFFEQAGKLVDKKCLTNLLCNIIVGQQLLLFNLFAVQEAPIYAAL